MIFEINIYSFCIIKTVFFIYSKVLDKVAIYQALINLWLIKYDKLTTIMRKNDNLLI